MKFGHDYPLILEQEGFPTEWVHSAISYRQLKKCIKKVRNELLQFGLSPDVLNQLWQAKPSLDDNDAGEEKASVAGFEYSFCEKSDAFVPKLTLLLDPKDGCPVDAFLSPETRKYLQSLSPCHDAEPPQTGSAPPGPEASSPKATSFSSTESESSGEDNGKPLAVEVPLSSDTEFFRILRRSVLALQDLADREQMELDRQVRTLRAEVVKVANSAFRRTDHSLYAWREVFRLYIDMQIFFSTDELDSGQRTAQSAHQQLQKFQATVDNDNQVRKLKKEGRVALHNFLQINSALLQIMKFQEVNHVALSKILKKFDKQTALRARAALPGFALREPLLAQSTAKVICQSIADELLSVIPQIDDYLCPICMNVAFKPVRLRCSHVFCIRCLVVMQRSGKDHCALCRGAVVMEATGENLDKKLLNFLSASFPKETKAKQKENERAATLDIYGDTYDSCSVM